MLPKGHRKSKSWRPFLGCSINGQDKKLLLLVPHVGNFVFSEHWNVWVFFFLPPTSSSAFFVFCGEFRPKIKEENPGISIGDIAKKLGELWATQTPKDKAPYAAKAGKLKEKYEKVSTWCLSCYKCIFGLYSNPSFIVGTRS